MRLRTISDGVVKEVSRVARGIRVAALACGVLICVAALAVGIARARPVELLPPGGPFPVGRQILTPPELGTPAWLWYPTTDDVAPPVAYVPESWSGAIPSLAGPGLVTQDLTTVRGHATDNPRIADGRFPLAILVPGLGVEPWLYTGEAEDLASRGWLVALPVPRSTPETVVAGRVVHTPDELISADAGNLADQVHRVDRTSAWLRERSGQAGDPLEGHVDVDTSLVLGHSFGGAVAVVACSAERSCRGAIDLDGTLTEVRGTILPAPLLVIGTEEGCRDGGVCDLPAAPAPDADQRRGTRTALTVAGADHFDFTDSAQLWIAPGLRAEARLGTIPGTRVAAIEAARVAAFARAATGARGDLDALHLDGPCRGEPEVVGVHLR